MAYRHLYATKRIGGKVKRYNSLRQFDAECSKRGSGNMCETVNVRCTKDGGGLATVKTVSFKPRVFDPTTGKHLHPSRVKSRYPDSGTWLLHFGSCELLKKTLRERTTPARAGLFGARRRKRRTRR